MNSILNVESEAYPIEDIRFPAGVRASHQATGEPLFFVSPVRLPIGERFCLVCGSVGYEFVVNGCFGFAYSLRFLVSGTIAAKQPVAA